MGYHAKVYLSTGEVECVQTKAPTGACMCDKPCSSDPQQYECWSKEIGAMYVQYNGGHNGGGSGGSSGGTSGQTTKPARPYCDTVSLGPADCCIQRSTGAEMCSTAVPVPNNKQGKQGKQQCYSQRRQKFMDEGTTFPNCLTTRGKAVGRCECKGGEWVEKKTAGRGRGRGAASRRRRTKYTKNNKKPRRVRRQGGSCSRAQSLQSTCVPTLTVMPPCPPRAGFECRYKPVSYEWIQGMTRTMLECCEAEREIYYVRDPSAPGAPGAPGSPGSPGSIINQRCHPRCANGRDRACMHECAQCVVQYGFACGGSSSPPVSPPPPPAFCDPVVGLLPGSCCIQRNTNAKICA